MSNKDEIIVIKGNEEKNKRHKRFIAILIAILLSIALITYTGVHLIYGTSTITVGVVELYPLKWAQGDDYLKAESLGYAKGWILSTQETRFSITVNGTPGLTVIIDDIFRVVNTTNVESFKVEIATAISGSLKSPIDKIITLKLRFWDGDTPPTRDTDPQVKGVLNLEGDAGTKTNAMIINGNYDMLKVQIIIELDSNALTTDYATVEIRLTDIIM